MAAQDRKVKLIVLGAVLGAAVSLSLWYFWKRKGCSKSKDHKSATLSSGQALPLVGLGTWKSKPGEVGAAVESAISLGYRHIDCAAVYGNEKEIGAALTSVLGDTKLNLKREDLFIVSKLWNTCHEPKDVLPACQQTLRDLHLAYLDLYLIHWPISFQSGPDKFPKNEDGTMKYAYVDIVETWKAMEDLVKHGLVKSIGLSNFNIKQITRILREGKIKPACLQIESHPYLAQEELIGFAKQNGIQVVAFSPLGSPDRPWAKPGDPSLLDDPKIVEIGKKYGKSAAQVVLKYQVDRGVAVIPKSVNRDRLKQNLDIFDFHLSASDVQTLKSFDRGHRFCIPTIQNARGETIPRDAGHPEFPFH